MRFGISATSWIFPKNLRTRLRPVNVCAAIVSLAPSYRRVRDDSPEGRNPSRPSGQASSPCDRSMRFDLRPDRCTHPPIGGYRAISGTSPRNHRLCSVGPGRAVSGLASGTACVLVSFAYLSSTLAPTFSRVALILSASSLFTPSLTALGAPSTRSLASLRPRPVSARTSLMTSIFLSPAAARIDGELGLLLDRSGGARRRARRHRDRGSGRDAPLLFEHLGELGRLENGEARRGRRRFSADQPLVSCPFGSNQSRLCEGPHAASLLVA